MLGNKTIRVIVKVDWINEFNHSINLIRSLFGCHNYFLHELLIAKSFDDFLTKCDIYVYDVLEELADHCEKTAIELRNEWNGAINQLWLEWFYYTNKNHFDYMLPNIDNKFIYVADTCFNENPTFIMIHIQL